MKAHLPVAKGKGSKNINMARNVGIAIAKSRFEDMLDPEMQGFMFSWNDERIPMVESNLFLYYSSIPKNLDELKIIAHDAAKLEFNILKEEYLKTHEKLPVNVFSDKESISSFVSLLTRNHVLLSQSKFYAEKEKAGLNITQENWKTFYLDEITIESLRQSAIQRAENSFREKNTSDIVKEEVMKQVNIYYDNITDLESMLYSSR